MQRMRDDELMIALLAEIYRQIPWHKIKVKSRWDLWNHRVRAAATRPTIHEFVSKLANYFSIQSLPPTAIQLAQQLEPRQLSILNRLYSEHLYFSVLSAEQARQPKQNLRLELNDEADQA